MVKNRFIATSVGQVIRAAIMFGVLLVGIVAVPAVAAAEEDGSQEEESTKPDIIKQRSGHDIFWDDREWPDRPGEHGENGDRDEDDDGQDDADQGEGDDQQDPDAGETEEPAIDFDAIMSFLADGQSLADYAALYGLTPEQVIDAVLAEIEDTLDLAVDSGLLTVEQADELLAAARDHLPALVGIDDADGEEEENDDRRPDAGQDDPDQGETPAFNVNEWISLNVVATLTGSTVADIETALAEDATLADFAAQFGISEDELVEALVADIEAQLDAAVDAGTLTPEQANEFKVDLDADVRAFVTGTTDDDQAPEGDDSTGQPENGTFNPAEGALEAIATLTGTTVEEIEDAVMSGQSLVEFAEAQGVSEADLVATVTAEVEAQITGAVESGELTQEEADVILAQLDQIVEAVVNATDLGGILGMISGDPALDECAPVAPVDAMIFDDAVAENVCPATS